jgi:hypothetical protein
MSELAGTCFKHTGRELIHTMTLDFIEWEKRNMATSAWPQFYQRICEREPALSFAAAHGNVYAGSAVMKALLDHQRKYVKLRNPRVTKEELRQYVSFSNLDCGPMEGKWIPADKILVVRG